MADDVTKPEQKSAEAVQEPPEGGSRKKLVTAGVAAGIGSAAIVAALLYAKSTRRNQD